MNIIRNTIPGQQMVRDIADQVAMRTALDHKTAYDVLLQALAVVEEKNTEPVTSKELNTAMPAKPPSIDSIMVAIDQYAVAAPRSRADVNGLNSMRRYIESQITKLGTSRQEPALDYSTFFYELATWMKIANAASRSPAEVWELVMFPNIKQTHDDCDKFAEALQKIGTALDLMVGDSTTEKCLPAIEKLKAQAALSSRGSREDTAYRGAKRAMEEFAMMRMTETPGQYAVRRERAWAEKHADDKAAVQKQLEEDEGLDR